MREAKQNPARAARDALAAGADRAGKKLQARLGGLDPGTLQAERAAGGDPGQGQTWGRTREGAGAEMGQDQSQSRTRARAGADLGQEQR